MLRKIKSTIEKYGLVNPGARVLAAVSGGPDSVALLRVLYHLSIDYRLQLAAIHYNHRLRGDESSRDESFVVGLCRSLGIELYVGSAEESGFNSGKKFSESAARVQRYAYFQRIIKEFAADRVALGHNADDQVETVLLNLFRGSGIAGLKGIPPLRDGLFIRPLLNVTRREILLFLKREGMPYLQDSSNLDDAFLRNKVRNQLIPYIKKNFAPALGRHLRRLSEIARIEDDYLHSQVCRVLGDIHAGHPDDIADFPINIDLLLSFHEAIVMRIVREWLRTVFSSEKETGFLHVAAVVEFIKKRIPGAVMILSRNWQVKIDGNNLFFMKNRSSLPGQVSVITGYCYEIDFPGQVKIPETNLIWSFDIVDKSPHYDQHGSVGIVHLDYDKIRPPLQFRTRREGDRIFLQGMTGSKSIKKYFIDRKIPREQRLLLPLLVDSISIIAIGNERVSSRVAVTEATRRLGRIQII